MVWSSLEEAVCSITITTGHLSVQACASRSVWSLFLLRVLDVKRGYEPWPLFLDRSFRDPQLTVMQSRDCLSTVGQRRRLRCKRRREVE